MNGLPAPNQGGFEYLMKNYLGQQCLIYSSADFTFSHVCTKLYWLKVLILRGL